MEHRIRAAAVILDNQHLLMLKVADDNGEYWILPGGGVEDSDADSRQALQRECWEEVGVTVDVGELLAVNEFKEIANQRYQLELFYAAHIVEGQPHLRHLAGLSDQDYIQSWAWVALVELENYRYFPRRLNDLVALCQEQRHSYHLGCDQA